jgi:NitT/TauT family transport system substrate-binding protein
VLVLVGLLGVPVGAQQQLTVVRAGIGISDTAADGYFAYEAGIFKKHGLDVQLTQMRGGAAAAAALAGGAVDVADGNVITYATARLKDIPFVAIAPGYIYDSRDPFAVIAVAVNSPIKSAKDLNGKVIGEPSLGGMAEAAIAAWADKNGGDYKTFKYTEVPSSETIAALELGRVDATVLQDPQLAAEVGRYRVLATNYDVISNHYYTTLWWSTTGYAAKNPDVIKRWQQSIAEASLWGEKNPDLAKAALEKWLKTKIPKIRHFRSATLEPALLQPMLDFAAKYQMIPRPVKASELIYTPPK